MDCLRPPWAGLSWGLLRRRGCPYAFVPHFRAGGRVSRSFHIPSVAVAMRHACPQVSVEFKMLAYVVARQSAQDPVGGPLLRRVVKPPADPIPRWPVARGPVLAAHQEKPRRTPPRDEFPAPGPKNRSRQSLRPSSSSRRPPCLPVLWPSLDPYSFVLPPFPSLSSFSCS